MFPAKKIDPLLPVDDWGARGLIFSASSSPVLGGGKTGPLPRFGFSISRVSQARQITIDSAIFALIDREPTRRFWSIFGKFPLFCVSR